MSKQLVASTLILSVLFVQSASSDTIWNTGATRDPALVIFVDGLGASLGVRAQAYVDCLGSGQLSRGEYETKAEFEARKSSAKQNCERLRTFEAYLEKNVNLKYDADNERFSFSVLGSAALKSRGIGPAFRGEISLNDPFVFNTCRPIAEKKWRGDYPSSLVTYDCPSSMYDNSFFKEINLIALIMIRSGGKDKGKPSYIHSFSLTAVSPIAKARLLKTMEKSLRIRLEGTYTVWKGGLEPSKVVGDWNGGMRCWCKRCSVRRGCPYDAFVVKGISLHNLENDAVLFRIR